MSTVRFNRRKAQRRRIELGLSTAELARRTGIPVWSIYSYEQPRAINPPPVRLRAIAEALEVEPGELLLDDEVANTGGSA